MSTNDSHSLLVCRHWVRCMGQGCGTSTQDADDVNAQIGGKRRKQEMRQSVLVEPVHFGVARLDWARCGGHAPNSRCLSLSMLPQLVAPLERVELFTERAGTERETGSFGAESRERSLSGAW